MWFKDFLFLGFFRPEPISFLDYQDFSEEPKSSKIAITSYCSIGFLKEFYFQIEHNEFYLLSNICFLYHSLLHDNLLADKYSKRI